MSHHFLIARRLREASVAAFLVLLFQTSEAQRENCPNYRSCVDCVTNNCVWCGAVLAGEPFTFGQCVSKDNCNDVSFGHTRSLRTLDPALIEPSAVTSLSSGGRCGPETTSEHELVSTDCETCVAGQATHIEFGWCELRKSSSVLHRDAVVVLQASRTVIISFASEAVSVSRHHDGRTARKA